MSEVKEESSMTIDGKVFDLNELGASLKDLKKGALLTTEYLKMEVGEVKRVVYVESAEINSRKNDGSKEVAVKLLDEHGSLRINADKALVSTLLTLKKLTPVEISCTGEKTSPQGTYKVFEVNALN